MPKVRHNTYALGNPQATPVQYALHDNHSVIAALTESAFAANDRLVSRRRRSSYINIYVNKKEN